MYKRRQELLRLAAVAGILLWVELAAASPAKIEWLPTQAPTRLAVVAAGIDAWLDVAVAAGSPSRRGSKAASTDESPNPSTAATRVQLQVHLALAQGSVAVVVFYGPAGAQEPGKISRQEGPLEQLGELFETAVHAVLPTALRSRPAPSGGLSLAGLTHLGRAHSALGSGRLRDSWKHLVGIESAAANRLRERILRMAGDPRTPVTERSRLGSIRGLPDTDWFEIRDGISAGTQPSFMIAGAEAALARGDRALAGRFYERALALDSQHPEGLRGRALLLAEGDQPAAARQAAEQALEVHPEDTDLLEALISNPAVGDEERNLRLGELGDAHAREWRSRAAFRTWERATPAHVASRRAFLLEDLGRRDDASEAFEAAVEVAPGDPAAWTGLGNLRLAEGDSAAAGRAFEQAVAIAPTNADALAGLGQSLLESDEPSRALAPLERAVEIRPNHANARRQLARGLRETGMAKQALQLLDPASVPRADQPGLLLDAAMLQQDAGDLEGARGSLEAAIQIEPSSSPLRLALAAVSEKQGRPEDAARERRWVAELAGQAPAPESNASRTASGARGSRFDELIGSFSPGRSLDRVLLLGVSREPGALAALQRLVRPRILDHRRLEEEILASLLARYPKAEAKTPDGAETIIERLRAFSTEADAIATANSLLESDAIVVGRLRRTAGNGLHLDLRFLVGGKGPMDPVSILENGLPLARVGHEERWNPAALGLPLLLVTALGLLFRRGWGTLVVELAWDQNPKRKGLFNIEVSRRPGQVQRVRRKDRHKTSRGFQKRGLQSRYKRNLVGAVTRLSWLPGRRYYVCVHGLLQDAENGEVIGNFLEESSVLVERGRVTTTAFDFRARESAVRVSLTRPEGFAEATALVGLAAGNSVPRYVRDDHVVISLEPGDHMLRIGCVDRAFEMEVRVEAGESRAVPVRLGDAEEALFINCPEAVEPFVTGDLAAAAEHLSAAGHSSIADRLRGEHLRQRGETAHAAKLFEAAGDLTTAAELRAEDSDPVHAATLLKESGDYRAAAILLEEAGDSLQAAEAFEAAYDYERALDAYRSAGALPRCLDLLEKLDRPYEAAVVAEELGEGDRAIQNLQQVDLRDPDYGEAALRLSGAFAEREQWVLAAEKLQEGFGASGASSAPLELLERLAEYQEMAGDPGSALETCEAILRRDLSRPGLDERIRELSSRSQSQSTEVQSPVSSAASSDEASLDERYEILGELGRGGMGIVYEARDRRLGRTVALKRLPESLHDNPTAVKLFLREAQSAAALNHPNIVTLFDAGQAGEIYYLTMELLQGQPLDQIQKSRGKLRPIDAARLGVQISTGLQYAHENRIVHRDIKTSNLFFTNDKIVKIMDFGLAKMMEEVRRSATVIGGTPYYMAPEQSAGENVDHRADLYAFGVTLFQLLTGTLPFQDGDVAYHHRHTPAPDPRERSKDIPAEFAELIIDLMAKSRDDRPTETREVTHRLEAIAACTARAGDAKP